MSKATDDVLAERRRQTEAEGWTEEHDDEHADGSLAAAAACYAMPDEFRRYEIRTDGRPGGRYVDEQAYITHRVPGPWPMSWAGWWWKPKDRRRDLVRAAALLIAEIERMDRLAEQAPNGILQARPAADAVESGAVSGASG